MSYMRVRKILKTETGQAQLLMVMVFATILATIGSATLSRTLVTRFQAIEFSRVTALRSALDATARTLGDIYRTQAQCDPYVFNQRINQMRPDGLIDPAAQKFPSSASAPTNFANYLRQLDVPVSPGVNVTVSIGRLQLPEYRDCVVETGVNLKGLSAAIFPNQTACVGAIVDDTNRPDFESGYTLDVQLEIWASLERLRVSQNVVFLNTCKTSNYVFTNAARDGINDPYFMYHNLVAEMDPTREQLGAAGATITEANMTAVRQMTTDTTAAWNGGTCSVDFNEDGAFNTEDIGILEKAMRGYLNYTDTQPDVNLVTPDSTGC